MKDVFLIEALRTPFGAFGGSLSEVPAPDLAARVISELVRRHEVPGNAVDEVIIGQVLQGGSAQAPARQASRAAGLPDSVHAMTINKVCGSGLKSLMLGADAIRLGEAGVVIAGGMESMSRVPHLLPGVRQGYRMGHRPVVDGMYRDGFDCPLAGMVMGETADLLARELGIPREEQDRYAARSQNRAEAAHDSGRFREELVPVRIEGRKGVVTVERDEHPRRGVTPEGLASLPPVFDPRQGTVTAGNASGITDGAAVLVLMAGEEAARRGIRPLAVLEEGVTAGVDPRRMGCGPVPAVRALEARTGRPLAGYDLVELNEAFAAQVLAVDRDLRFDHERLNVNGGAIALGHPVGASGARIVVTLLHELRRRGGRAGLATLCVSGGLGLAASFAVED